MDAPSDISMYLSQFSYAGNGGSASAVLSGSAPRSNLDAPALAIVRMVFSLWPAEPVANPESRVVRLRLNSPTGRPYRLLGFTHETAVPKAAKILLADKIYRARLATLVANAEERSLADPLPKVI